MDDSEIRGHIEALVAEEHRLWELEASGDGTDADREQIRQIKVTLDRYWDLLRQRRALREFNLDPDAAMPRGADTVEGYEQ
jgi:hypothetical protein